MGSCQSSPSAVDATKRTAKDNSLDPKEVFRDSDPECAVATVENSMVFGEDGPVDEDDVLIGGKDSKPSTPSSEPGDSATTREKIESWKKELEASGNLTKTVVNIEVSIVR